MAPTETLAEQHFLTLEPLCAQLGVRCVLLTGSVGSKRIRDEIANGVAQIAVGTHALIQRDVEFADLAVAVVDEQHRFGVEQRTALAENRSTHVLHMTATPIPRTLALTIYGDLSVSEIAKPPANRKPIITARVGADRSSEAYMRLRVHLDAGRQAYVVCPLIELSETRLARAAEAEAERLRRAELRDYRVGLLHGKLKTAERREVMRQFKDHELDVLVATTVIEVGVDVPNSTIMIVQEADRFGLAQLHQLRGRVGRGGDQSYCLLISRPLDELTETADRRLQALVDTTDGFELAEIDLDLRRRGPAARHPPVRLERSAVHEATARPRPDRAGPPDRREPARRGRPLAGRGRQNVRRCGSSRAHIEVTGSPRPTGRDTRPTSDRVRENAFNLIGPVDDADVLDLFAGSGASGARGALARRRDGHVRRVRPRGLPHDQRESGQAQASRHRPLPGGDACARAGAPQLRPRPLRPAVRLRPRPAHPTSGRPVERATACWSTRPPGAPSRPRCRASRCALPASTVPHGLPCTRRDHRHLPRHLRPRDERPRRRDHARGPHL